MDGAPAYKPIDIVSFNSKLIGVPTGVAAGVGIGVGLHNLVYAINRLDDAYVQRYKDNQLSIVKLDSLSDVIGPEALVTLSPQTVLERLSQTEEMLASNRDYFSAQGVDGLEQIIPLIIPSVREEVQHFVADWPDNAYKWYPYFYGGTAGTDFELGAEGELFLGIGNISSVRGDEFYLGEGLGYINSQISSERKELKTEIAQYNLDLRSVEDNADMAGIFGGAAGIIVASVIFYNVAHRLISKRVMRHKGGIRET